MKSTRFQPGAANINARLTEDQVCVARYMRDLARSTGKRRWGACDLAKEWGVDRQTVERAARNISHKEA